MAKAIISKDVWEKLHDVLKQEYKLQDDGRYVFNIEPVDGYKLENVDGLVRALETERGTNKTLSTSLKAFEGIDASRIREELKELETLRSSGNDSAKVEARINSLKQQLESKYTEQINAEKQVSSKFKAQLESALIDTRAGAAIEKLGGVAQLLLPHVKPQIKMVQGSDGTFVPEVVDAQGNPRISRKTSGANANSPMQIEELVESMRSDPIFSMAFKPNGSAGSGAGGNGAGGSGGNNQGKSQFALTAEQAADFTLYQTTKAAAEKAGQQIQIIES